MPDDRNAMAQIVPVLFGHAAFQQLNAAAELGLFELLDNKGELTKDVIAASLSLSDRSTELLLLGACALQLVDKNGDEYRNGRVIAEFFEAGQWPVLRDIIEFQARIGYVPLSDYTQSLRENRNVGIRHFPGDADNLYARLTGLEDLFYRGMHAWSRLSNPVLIEQVDYTKTQRILDVGGGDAVNAIALAQAQPHIKITVLDREPALEIAQKNITEAGLSDRIDTYAADMFGGAYPLGYDTVLFAHQFVIWSLERNLALLTKAYDALDPGGRVLIFNAMSDDDGRGPLYTALDNVFFATLPFAQSTIYPWGVYRDLLQQAGFREIGEVRSNSWTPHGVAEGYR